MDGELGPIETHTVVFDVNIYLTAARFIGLPFTWQRFETAALERARNWVGSYDKTGGDSAVALLTAASGYFVQSQPLNVWTSDHIQDTVYTKAMAPPDAEDENDRGLGWSASDAESILVELHDRIVPEARTVWIDVPQGQLALGWEDGKVLATAREAGYHTDEKYCVTKDRGFRAIGDPNGPVMVLKPHEFVNLVRESRRAIANLRRPRPPTSR